MASKKIIICSRCNRERPHGAHGLCDVCNAKEWAAKNPEKRKKAAREGEKRRRAANPELAKTKNRKYRESLSWEVRVLRSNHPASKERRANLSIDFLAGLRTASTKCVCCSIELDFTMPSRGKMPSNFATLDKIVPELGYIKTNVAIICLSCNMLKSALTLDQLRMILSYIEKYS